MFSWEMEKPGRLSTCPVLITPKGVLVTSFCMQVFQDASCFHGESGISVKIIAMAIVIVITTIGIELF